MRTFILSLLVIAGLLSVTSYMETENIKYELAAAFCAVTFILVYKPSNKVNNDSEL